MGGGFPEKSGFRRWLEHSRAHIKETPQGARLDVRVYVYPDGHGNLATINPGDGKVDPRNQPVNDIEEAVAAFRQLWRQAQTLREGASPNIG